MLIDQAGYSITTVFERLVKHIRWALPEGWSLPDDVWQPRHRGILVLLWLHVIGIICFGVMTGVGLGHSLIEGAVLVPIALAASWQKRHRKFRSSIASLGLITASALLVHLSGGYIEVHFHFFVMLAIIMLYQDWIPFLLALGYVVIHHGLVGVLDPTSVYNHPDAFAHPWKWAAIHGGFVLAASIAGIVSWRLNEALRAHNELILNSTGEGIIGLDLQGKITFMNPAAARMLGYEIRELKGRVLLDLFRRSQADDTLDHENEHRILVPMQGEAVQSAIEGAFGRKDGTSFLTEYVSTPIRAGGEVVGAVVTFKDITERKQAQAALQKAKDELEIRVAERTAELKDTNERLHFELAERKQAEEALRQSEQRFRQVVSSISDHIYVTEVTEEGEHINLYVSPHLEPLTGYPLDKFLTDWSFWPSTVIHPDDRAVAAVQAAQLAMGQSGQIEYRLIRANGDIIWVRDSGQVEKDTVRQSLIIYGLVSDITERKHAEEALTLAHNQALEASRLKTEFLTTMSHELRTPLNSIIGFSEIILAEIDGPLTELQRTDLTSIHLSGQHLLGRINDVLDLSKLMAGQMELNLEDVDLKQKIDMAVSTATDLLKDKLVTLEERLPDQPLLVPADRIRLQQILFNLISNAIKFTAAGQITVTASRTDDWVTVSLSDTGIGIPPEKLSDIFNEFTQVDSSNTRHFEGAGLGLSITKKLVELHGGRIWVESTPSQGSTFSFTLPAWQPSLNCTQLPSQEPLKVGMY